MSVELDAPRPPATAVTDTGLTEPTTGLIRDALVEARELVQIEVALAREDVTGKLAGLKTASLVLLASTVAFTTALSLLLAAVALAMPVPWLAATIIGAVVLVAAVVLAFVGVRSMPSKFLETTTDRVGSHIETIKERLT
jgi:hypothetical protein